MTCVIDVFYYLGREVDLNTGEFDIKICFLILVTPGCSGQPGITTFILIYVLKYNPGNTPKNRK